MTFALGFLVASLLGLLVLPAVNARAARLARRRAEARLPLSPAEIAAERDFLRAQNAVRERRLERAVETAKASRHADMVAIGAGTMKAAALTRDIAARDAQIAEIRQENGTLETTLASAREEGSASLSTLLALEEAHADLLDSLLALRHREPEAGPATAEDEGAAAITERDALRASLAAAEQALAEANGAGHESIERENADLRRRITEVADALVGQARMPKTETFAAPQPEPERV